MGEDTIHGLWKYIEYLTTKASDVPNPTRTKQQSNGKLGKTKKQRKAEKKQEKRRQRMINDECRACSVDETTAEVELQAEKDIAEEESKAHSTPSKRSIDTYTVAFLVTLPQGAYAGFLDQLKSMGFTQIEVTRTAYLDSNTKKACPMGYRGRSYPYCGYKQCSYFNHHDGCVFYGTTRRGAW